MTPVAPFRWELLPRLDRDEANLARAAAAVLGRGLLGPAEDAASGWDALSSALRGLLGVELPPLQVGPVRALRAAELRERVPAAPWVAVRVGRSDGAAFAVVVDGALAGAVTAAALGAPAPLGAPRRATPAEKGVLALVVATALDALAAPGLVVDGCVDEPDALAQLLGDGWIVALEAVCRVGSLRGSVRLLAPESLLLRPAPRRAARELRAGLGPLGEMSVRLAVVRGVARVGAADLAALTPRDVVLLEPPGAAPSPGAAVRLVLAPRGGHGFRATLRGATLTIAHPYEHHPEEPVRCEPPSCEPPTSEQGACMSKPAAEALVDDVPVELEARLGVVTLPLRQLLELGPGAVVPLGRPLGTAVELAASGRVVARGELVDVEGELGVRVLEIVR